MEAMFHKLHTAAITAQLADAMAAEPLSAFATITEPTLIVSLPPSVQDTRQITLDLVEAFLVPGSSSVSFEAAAPKQLEELQKAFRGDVLSELLHNTGSKGIQVRTAGDPLEETVRLLVATGPFTDGGRRQGDRDYDGNDKYISDGLRCCPGGDPQQPTFPVGKPSWYSNINVSNEEAKCWRACRAPFLSLVHALLRSSLGEVLLAFQTGVNQQPGLDEPTLRLQADVPYQQMCASSNAQVGCHVDKGDLLGTSIAWLSFPGIKAVRPKRAEDAAAAAGMPFQPPLIRGAFVAYTLGFKLPLHHMSHVYLRSERVCHGSVRDHRPDLINDGAMLFGIALYNKTDVTQGVLKALLSSGCKTWEAPSGLSDSTVIRPTKQCSGVEHAYMF